MTGKTAARWILPAVLLCSCVTSTSRTSGAAGAGTEILWDTYGVPHIFAADRNGLARAFGWAQMQNHGDLILRLYAQARGRASEILGETYLDEDRWVWTMGIPARSEQLFARQSGEMRAHVSAFADGMNAFAAAHPELIGDSVRAVLPVRPTDAFAHLQRGFFAAFITSREGVRDATDSWAERGSNAWAIAPSRSASGNSMLLANPHLPWGDFFTWMEAQLVMPGVNLHGAVLVGAPVLQIAFNDRLGWTHTVNTQDGEDLYELTLSGNGYMWDGAVRAFDHEQQILRVRRPDGTFILDTVGIRRSVHGPVVRQKVDKAIALRVVGLDFAFVFEQWWNMGRSRNFAEFLDAIRPNQISGQNITYADRDGHIMMFYGGNTPVRPVGDRPYWAGIVRGDSSRNLWTQLHPFDYMPRITDPPSGWVQNANEPPWWATFPATIRRTDYAPYLASRTMTLRAQRSVLMLDSDPSVTFEELVAYKHSTRMLMADRVLDDLLPVVNERGSSLAKRAAAVLAAWDRNADVGSRGGVLFVEWWRALERATPSGQPVWARPWNEASPRTTPDGLANAERAVAALDSAAALVQRRYGDISVPWGDVYRLQRSTLDLPANGAADTYGVFRVVGYESIADFRYRATGGDSYVAAIEFGSPMRARTLIGSGNSSRMGSPHRVDQLPLFSSKQLKPVWRSRAEIEANLERRERF